MSIFRTPYDTTVGRHIVINQIEKDILQGIVVDGLESTGINILETDGITSIGIMGSCGAATRIPFFANPLIVKDGHRKTFLAMDYRPFTTPLDKNNCKLDSVRIKNQTDFNLALNRQVLTLAWITGAINDIKNTCRYPSYLFPIWISQALAQRYALDPGDQYTIQIITDFYYQSLFIDGSTYSEDEKRKFSIHTIKATKAKPALVNSIFDQIDHMSDMESLCTNIVKIVDNVRLEGLNAGILVTLLANSWYGTYAREMISVSLEYPPVWIALVQAAMVEKTFKHTKIANLADRFKMNGENKTFLSNIERFVSGYLNKTSKLASLEDLDPENLKPLVVDGDPDVKGPLTTDDNKPQVFEPNEEPHTEELDDATADEQKTEGVVEPNIAEVIHSEPHVQPTEWEHTSKPIMDPIVDENGGLQKDQSEDGDKE